MIQVSAFSSNVLMNSTNSTFTRETFNFTGVQSITRYLQVPSDVVLTSGFINLTMYGASSVVTNIVSYYKLDGSSGPVVDSTGLNNGVNNDATPHVSGKINTAYQFHGNSQADYINLSVAGVSNGLNFTTYPFSINAWIYVTGATTGNEGIYGSATNGGIGFYYKDATKKLAFAKLGSAEVFSTGTIDFGRWAMATVVYNSTGANFFINGTFAGASAFPQTFPNTGDYRLGYFNWGGSLGSLYGSLDEVGVWNKELTPSEIQTLYNSYNGNSYPFGENSNFILSVSNSSFYNVSVTKNTYLNIVNPINSYLSTCSYLGGYCNVPIIFSSLNSANLTYSDLSFVNGGFNENSQTFNTTAYETATESFILNMSFDTNYYQLSSANLYYNGSIYPGTSSGNTFYSIINLPTITNTVNNAFYWNVSLTNSSGTFYFISTTNNQIINPIILSVCNSTLTTKALNFTFLDEETLSRITTGIFNGVFNYSLTKNGVSKIYTYNNLSANEVDICINQSGNIFSSITINYNNATGSNYGVRYWSEQGYVINNSRQDIPLYLLKSTSTTTFIILVQDNNLLSVPDVTVETYRFFSNTNTFQIVQSGITDVNGQTTGQFVINTGLYKFVVKNSNGDIIYSSTIQSVIPTTTPYTITLAIGNLIPNPLIPLSPLSNLAETLTYSKSTNLVIFSYSDTSNNFTNSSFIVAIQNYSNGNDWIVCNISSPNPNAILKCDLSYTGNKTGTYYANGIINRGGINYIVANTQFTIETFSSIMGMFGIILGAIIIMVCAFMFKFNEIAGVWMIVVACIFDNVMGLINFGWVFMTGLIAVAIVLTIIFKQ